MAATPESKIGLSLSLCVTDILHGRVAEEEVLAIVSSTAADGPEQIYELLENYGENYWHDGDPWSDSRANGKAIATRLFDAGKVYQPRIEDKNSITPSPILMRWIGIEEAWHYSR